MSTKINNNKHKGYTTLLTQTTTNYFIMILSVQSEKNYFIIKRRLLVQSIVFNPNFQLSFSHTSIAN